MPTEARIKYYREYVRARREAERPIRIIAQIKMRWKKLDKHYQMVCLKELIGR